MRKFKTGESMLEELYIENLAVIEKACISFRECISMYLLEKLVQVNPF